jgi:hypothetical protein
MHMDRTSRMAQEYSVLVFMLHDLEEMAPCVGRRDGLGSEFTFRESNLRR